MSKKKFCEIKIHNGMADHSTEPGSIITFNILDSNYQRKFSGKLPIYELWVAIVVVIVVVAIVV